MIIWTIGINKICKSFNFSVQIKTNQKRRDLQDPYIVQDQVLKAIFELLCEQCYLVYILTSIVIVLLLKGGNPYQGYSNDKNIIHTRAHHSFD